jgi:serine/threonine-protein kinase
MAERTMLVGKEIGPFFIERELGSGAMGSVYKAVNRKNGQHVALKFIALGLLANETAVKRFEREAKILKRLRHPNIVRLIADGHYNKTPFIVMEYVEGVSLDRVLARRDVFPWDEVVALGRQLCDALQHAHEKGIIHRDLKPSNVMILKDGTVKLTDFGIAKDTDFTALTGANSTVGTAAYMSPEQCKGERNLSKKSDLYSMGVMFYELLTGRKPFIAESPIDMFQQHVTKQPERPSRLVLGIPVWLDTLVCQLLEKKPELRPFDAAMVKKVLGEVAEKVAEQRSAGVDAVTARATDRVAGPADETDRAAGRTLRAAVSKKKPRPQKSVPLGERKWLRATGLVAALAAVVGVIAWATKPPSTEQLYVQAKAALDAKDSDRALDAIGRYLSRPDAPADARALELRDARERLMVEKRERQLFNRFYSPYSLKPEDEGQKLAFQAIQYENDGKLDVAGDVWREMASKFRNAEGPEVAVYGWLGRKKLADLASLPTREQRLKEVLDQEHALVPPERRPQLSPVEQGCFEALRYQSFGDLPAAFARWDRVRDNYLKDLDARPWAVLAAGHVRQLQPAAGTGGAGEKDERLKLLQAQLERAKAIPANSDATDRRTAVSICRDLIALYGEYPDPKVSAFAQQASQFLKSRGW